MTGEQVRDYFHARVASAATSYNINPGIKGAIIGILKRACGGDDNRRLVLKYLCDVTSSSKLTPAQWAILSEMVKPDKPQGMPWQSGNKNFQRAIDAVLASLPKQEGQEEMILEDLANHG